MVGSEKKSDESRLLALPCIHGAQAKVQWSEIEPRQGHYDFSALDRRIAALAAKDRWCAVQVNANTKPAWLFDVVPRAPEKFHDAVKDPQGTLMYWHPAYQEAHLAMLRALAAHLRENPRRDRILGIRMNFNAVATEQLSVPDKYRKASAWIWPHAPASLTSLSSLGSLASLPVPDYSDAFRDQYIRRVVDTYIKEFSPWTLVLVRNNIDDDLVKQLDPDFRAGRLGLCHTSSEVEPRTAQTERRYGLFYDYARAGHTVAYAEPWASAWGEHGRLDVRWCSPCQWAYWTLLFDMHCGVSFVGEYYTNIDFAVTATHPRFQDKTKNPAQQAREFTAAYEWADRYIGLHARPDETPGAWVAFRENHAIKARNKESGGDRPEHWQLTRFSGDYNFLMTRIGADGTPDSADGSAGVGPVGPEDERYGAFARAYPAGGRARLKLDPRFLASLAQGSTDIPVCAKPHQSSPVQSSAKATQTAQTGMSVLPCASGATVRVTYLDDTTDETATVSLNTAAGDSSEATGSAKPLGALPRTASGHWRVAEFALSADDLAALAAAAADWQFAVSAGDKPLILHMVEITRK